MRKNVIKRNGEERLFDETKIENAIRKAAKEKTSFITTTLTKPEIAPVNMRLATTNLTTVAASTSRASLPQLKSNSATLCKGR